MFTRPNDLPDAVLIDALSAGWELCVASLEYRAIGFGSHHWGVTDTDGRRSFVTVDDLDAKRRSSHDSTGVAFDRLRAALTAARSVRDAGAGFVVAPLRSRDGEILRWVTDRFALALYPHIDGRTYPSGDYESVSDRLAVLDLIVTLHAANQAATCEALTDEFLLPHRDELVLVLGDLTGRWDNGPYSEPARALLSSHAWGVERLLNHYDRLVGQAQARPDRMVLTHGEPHIQNVIRTEAGWMLIDWDTTLVGPPERDLWMLESGDGSVIGTYEEATGTPVLPSVLDLYRLWWDLAEVAIYVAQFRRPHAETSDVRHSWKNLVHFLDPERRWPALG